MNTNKEKIEQYLAEFYKDENGFAGAILGTGAEKALYWALENLNLWNPASEPPPVDENGNSKELFAVDVCGCLEKVYYHVEPEKDLAYWVISRDYNLPEIVFETEWWSYPPQK